MPPAGKFDTLLHAATGGHTPDDDQRRLACGEPGRTVGPSDRRTVEPLQPTSRLISIPTGPGQTASLAECDVRQQLIVDSEELRNVQPADRLEKHADSLPLADTARPFRP
jgi:hypothetical protein